MTIAKPAFMAMMMWLFCSQLVLADDFVRRKTDSSASDLIDDLLARGMIDTASKICDQHLADTQVNGDEKAKWLIESSRTRIAAMLRGDSGTPEQLSASKVIEEFLISNPEHERRLWLELQIELVELAATRQAVMAAIVKPPNDPARDEALKEIVRIGVRLRELSQSIESEIAIERTQKVDSERTQKVDSEKVQELLALAIVVANKRIESIMLRGEMFAEGSNDYIASANESLAASRELVDSLPADAPSREDLVEKVAESLRRTGELDEALVTITTLLQTDRNDTSRRAIAAKIAINQGDFSKARQWLVNSDDPDQVPSIEIELVRLQLAIATAGFGNKSKEFRDEIGDRIELIGKQFGAYSRRRAEQLVLDAVLPTSPQELDPRLLIAQAASRVREGQPEQAAQWLATASRAAQDPADAIQLAIAGAAAFRQAKDLKSASALLQETSLARFESPDAAKLHLQSAVLVADLLSPDLLIESLEECIATWPKDPIAASATDWLIRLHEARGNVLQAARATSLADTSTMSVEATKKAGELWLNAIAKANRSDRSPLADEAVNSIMRSTTEATVREAARLAILFREPAALNGFDSKLIKEPWLEWLFEVRRGGTSTNFELPDSVDSSLRHVAAERLVLDGQASRLDHGKLARAILLLEDNKESLVSAQAWLWMNDWKRADEIVIRLCQKHPDDLAIARDAAALLCQADDKEAKLSGRKLWMIISSRLPQGTAQWHDAKLAVISSLRASGEAKQASQMAEYILLTKPPSDAETFARYETMK